MVQNPGPSMLLGCHGAEFARGGVRECGCAQIVRQRLVAVGIVFHLIDDIALDTRAGDVPAGRHPQARLPERALRMPDALQSDARARNAAPANSGVWYPVVSVKDLASALDAVPPIECRIIRFPITGADLRKTSDDCVAHAARHGVVGAETHAVDSSTPDRQLQPAVILRAEVVESIHRSEQPRGLWVLQRQHAPLVEVVRRVQTG